MRNRLIERLDYGMECVYSEEINYTLDNFDSYCIQQIDCLTNMVSCDFITDNQYTNLVQIVNKYRDRINNLR